MFNIENLKFDSNGLIPAIVVDAISGKVLTLAYMNRESLAISMEKGLTCFWSRSRQELWLKGETSGNYQHIVSITADCDGDALVVKVEKDGPACHKGSDSCFEDVIWQSDDHGLRQSHLFHHSLAETLACHQRLARYGVVLQTLVEGIEKRFQDANQFQVHLVAHAIGYHIGTRVDKY